MKTFPIRIRTHGKYYFRGQEDKPSHRSAGTIIGDASLENAAFYIANGTADLWTGSTGGATYLNSQHPQSNYQRGLKRRAEQDFLIRIALQNQTPTT